MHWIKNEKSVAKLLEFYKLRSYFYLPSLKIWYNGLAFKVYSNYVPVLQPCYFFFKFMKPNVLHFILFKLTAYLTEITVDNPPM